MGFGSIMAGIGAAIAGGIANSVNKNKNNSSSSNSSKGSSGGGGSSGGYQSTGTHYDSYVKDQNPQQYDQIQQYKQQYDDAKARGDQAGMQEAHAAAEAIRAQNGYSGGADGSEYNTNGMGGYGEIENQYNKNWDQIEQYLANARDESQRAQQAAVEQSVNSLNAQKGAVNKAGETANAAAEKAYMQTVKPNGSLAESLAANGLLTSGLTETSQISAGNEYQNALNSNQTMVQEQLAEIERAITAARLNGDIASAEMLASYAQQVAALGQQNAQNVLSFRQWATENAQNQAQNNVSNSIAWQQLEMQKKKLEQEFRLGTLTEEQYKWQNKILEQQLQELLLSNRYSAGQLNSMGY